MSHENNLFLKLKKKYLNFLKKQKPDFIFIAAAKVGGILANNDFPYQFLMENMQIQNNLIDSAFKKNQKVRLKNFTSN